MARYAKIVRKLPVYCPYYKSLGEYCMLLPGASIRNVAIKGTRWRFEGKASGHGNDWQVCYSQIDPTEFTDRKQVIRGRLPEGGSIRLTSSQTSQLRKIASAMSMTEDEALAYVLRIEQP